MNRTQNPFQALERLEPPRHLHAAIVARVEAEILRSARVRLALLGALALAALIALVPAFQYAMQEGARSGFHQYLSLLFSDAGTVLLDWRQFILTLAESLPLIGSAIFLSTIFVLLLSLRAAADAIKTVFLKPHFNH